jgi:sec-independent protein translocase protein TatC
MSVVPGEPDPFEHTRMTLGEHLDELRRRVLRAALAVGIAFAAAWYFKDEIAELTLAPYREAAERLNADRAEALEERLRADPTLARELYFTSSDPASRELRPEERIDPRPILTGVGEGFFFALDLSLYAALLASSPFVLWQLWLFVAAGLYPHEKRGVRRYFPLSVLLFAAGAVFCFVLILPTGIYYLYRMLPLELARPQPRLSEYFSFVTTMTLAMGLVFQLPVVMVFLARFGLVEPSTYGRYRAHFVVAALAIAAVVTPGPDVFSQLMMAGPMLVLYEAGILVSRLVARPRHAGAPART